MKQITLSILICLFCLTGMTAQTTNTVIKYTADSKLPEVTGTSEHGLHTTAFAKEILSHEFKDGQGTITFNGEITAFGVSAFYYSEAHTFEIPSGITELGKSAMDRSTIDSLVIPKTIAKIGSSCFNSAALYAINYLGTISDWLQINFGGNFDANPLFDLASKKFYIDGKLATEIEIPDGVTTINDYQLAYNPTTTKYTLPASLATIKAKAFRNNSALTTIICAAVVPPTCGVDVFKNVPTSCTIYVPAESVDAYKAADGWKGFAKILPLPTNTVIKYTADSKLPEVTGTSEHGLHTTAFAKEILSQSSKMVRVLSPLTERLPPLEIMHSTMPKFIPLKSHLALPN